MNPSYKVRIWAIKARKNSNGKITSYGVRWSVDGKAFYESYKVRAQAEGRRSDLISAQRRGEAFDRQSGLPASMTRAAVDMTWYEFACAYLDVKWPGMAATARQTVAESLIRLTPVFLPNRKTAPSAKEVRSALRQWGYNTELRGRGDVPANARRVLDWCARNSLSVKEVLEPATMRALERAATTRLDGKPFAPTVARKTRSVLSNALDFAVEQRLIDRNPMVGTKWTGMPKGKRAVDKRAVPNPIQARTLLNAVREVRRSGGRLEAFFGAMYFAALRPEEVVALNKRNLSLPLPRWNATQQRYEHDWGEIHLEEAWPHVGKLWTDGKQVRDRRQLKSRSAGEGRTVPCAPELTALLLRHMEKYPPADDGRIFVGEKGGEIPMITYTRVWRGARAVALSPEAEASPLARRPYDLRHAAVSTWLAAGVPATTVADWAGHSVSVLLEIYAACLHGQDILARRQVQAALGYPG